LVICHITWFSGWKRSLVGKREACSSGSITLDTELGAHRSKTMVSLELEMQGAGKMPHPPAENAKNPLSRGRSIFNNRDPAVQHIAFCPYLPATAAHQKGTGTTELQTLATEPKCDKCAYIFEEESVRASSKTPRFTTPPADYLFFF
jgi:hypothetical protein